jgi:hypothetical protein
LIAFVHDKEVLLKKLWLEVDVSGTLGDDAWVDLEQPKGFIDGGITKESSQSGCNHPIDLPHSEGEWREAWVQIEDLHVEDAIRFYKEKERVLSVETDT